MEIKVNLRIEKNPFSLYGCATPPLISENVFDK